MVIRFSSRLPASSAVRPTYANPNILPPLAVLVHPKNQMNGEQVSAFTEAWAENPRGAIVTLSQIVDQAIEKLKQPHGNKFGPKREDAAYVAGRLKRFVAFFRREFWDEDLVGRMIQEFKPKASRSEDMAANARNTGIPWQTGSWHSFVGLIQQKALPEFYSILSPHLPDQEKKPLPPTPIQTTHDYDDDFDYEPFKPTDGDDDFEPFKPSDDFLD